MQHDDRTAPGPSSPATGTRPGVLPAIDRFLRALPPATWPVSLAVIGLAGAVLLHFVSPEEPGSYYPACPWFALTGTHCPGCGTTRALALLTHLDLTGAVSMNPLLFALAPLLVYSYVTWLVGTLRSRPRPRAPLPTWFPWALLAVVLVYWIARNLPWFSFLAPGTPLLPGW